MRETEEQAKRDGLTMAETNKAATDRAAKLEVDAAAIRSRRRHLSKPIHKPPHFSRSRSMRSGCRWPSS